MPTLECLDERSRLIIKTLDELSTKISLQHQEIRMYIEERERKTSAAIKEIQDDIEDLKLTRAEERGKKSTMILLGGIALTALSAMFGAVGNILYEWLTGPHGPIRLN